MLRVVALNRKMGTSRLWTMVVVFGVFIPLVACNTSQKPRTFRSRASDIRYTRRCRRSAAGRRESG